MSALLTFPRSAALRECGGRPAIRSNRVAAISVEQLQNQQRIVGVQNQIAARFFLNSLSAVPRHVVAYVDNDVVGIS